MIKLPPRVHLSFLCQYLYTAICMPTFLNPLKKYLFFPAQTFLMAAFPVISGFERFSLSVEKISVSRFPLKKRYNSSFSTTYIYNFVHFYLHNCKCYSKQICQFLFTSYVICLMFLKHTGASAILTCYIVFFQLFIE